jgi:hypothetical protein
MQLLIPLDDRIWIDFAEFEASLAHTPTSRSLFDCLCHLPVLRVYVAYLHSSVTRCGDGEPLSPAPGVLTAGVVDNLRI